MKWKWILAAGVIAGAAVAARRRNQKAAADSDLWAAATDPVAPSSS
jgi:hypothetical protein